MPSPTRQQQISRYAGAVQRPERRAFLMVLIGLAALGLILLIGFGQSIIRTSLSLGDTATTGPRASADPLVTLGTTQTAPLEYSESPVLGPAAADVTIYEFGDFECQACAVVQSTVTSVLEEYGSRVRLVWKDYPLTFHLQARRAANAARCGQAQGKFWEMQAALFATDGTLTADSINAAANEAGLDVTAFDECLAAATYDSLVERDFQEAVDLQIGGVPFFIIGDRRIEGAESIGTFREVIDDAIVSS